MSIKNSIASLAFIVLLLAACKKDDDQGDVQSRLFRPVLKEELKADGNWVAASWQAIKGASTYTVQLSRDTFKTIDKSQNVDTNYVLFEELEWSQNYQVQVRANSTDTTLNSKLSYLGNIKTPKFPTILNSPSASDVTDEALRVSWTNSGATVTSIKVFNATDNSLIKEVALTTDDVSNQFKIVSGLQSNTTYVVYLYSGTTARGWDNFKTKSPLSGSIIDLRNITDVPTILIDTLPDIPSGSTILLKRGHVYTLPSSYSLDKAVTFRSGDDLTVTKKAEIFMNSNFNIATGSNIDYIDFIDVRLFSDSYGGKYVFNINTACTIGRISFESCHAEIFRGIVRTQSNPAKIENFIVNNSILDSLAGYGVITVDVATSEAKNITIKNSTIYKAEKIVTSRNNSASVTIENCTINEAPGGNNYLIDFSTSGTNNVTGGIKVTNCLFGIGKSVSGNTAVRGIRVAAGTAIDASNNFSTSDYVLASTTPLPIPNVIAYSGLSTTLWQDPVNGDFRFKDNGFSGKNTTGDPRWRP